MAGSLIISILSIGSQNSSFILQDGFDELQSLLVSSRQVIAPKSWRIENLLIGYLDNHSDLLPLLRSNPSLASSQDEHGYSLMHAAASYNHLHLLRTLVTEFNVNVDIKDEDGETALFVAETVECVKLLVEELHADISIRGEEEKTAREKIEEEGDFTDVAVYLRIKELEGTSDGSAISLLNGNGSQPLPPMPNGVTIDIGTMVPEEDAGEVADPELRSRIEELAQREDFQDPSGQAALRELITDAIMGTGEGREVRRRTE